MKILFALALVGIVIGAALCMPHMTKKSSSSGKALIGGDFTLTNHLGEPVTAQTYKGKYLLVYFGFTSCPSICPTDIAIISHTMTLLGSAASEVVPLFITVDPKRDTPEKMKTYLSNFHSSFVGLTGTEEQLKAAAFAYKVYSAEEKDDSSTDGYTMNHSAYSYFMDREGQYLTHFPHDSKPEDMAAAIQSYIK